MITIHPAKADDFASLGYGALQPTEAAVEEHAGGMYQLTLTHPMDAQGRWWNLQKYNIIKAPAPVRETPRIVIDGESTPGKTVTRQIYKVNTPHGGRLRLRKRPSLSAKVITLYKPGTKVVRLSVSGSWAKVAICKGGATGYMWNDYLAYVSTQTETTPGKDVPGRVIEAAQTQEQLFRISRVEKDDAAGAVRVTALHISYDLTGNAIRGGLELDGAAADEAVATVLAQANDEHPFEVFCAVKEPVSGDFTGKSVAAALWGDGGIVEQTGARLVRDNYSIYILPDEERDRGVEIRHGKNMLGAVAYEDASETYTRIIPVGMDKNGNRLMLEAPGYVESPRASGIPVIRSKEIEYDVQVGKDGISTAAQARAKLKQLAEADFEAGADAPVVGLDVDFVQLENTREYARYAELQSVHLYDTVHIISGPSDIRAGVRMTGYVYDVASDKPRYSDATLGRITEMETTFYGYDLAEGSTPGTKLLNGSVGGAKLRNASIQYAKIAQAAIEQLTANSITAVRAHINELVAGSITTDQLYADLATLAAAQITAATIEKANIDWAAITTLRAQIATIAQAQITTANIKAANIDWAQIETLTAKMADIAQAKIDDAEITTAQIRDLEATIAAIAAAKIGSADIGFAQIKDLVANKAIITEGVGGQLYIARLAVTEANMVSLTVGELIVKGSDGGFYALGVDADGNVTTTVKQIANSDVKNLSINAGEKLIEGTVTAACLNVNDIFANNAIIRQLIAANIDVATLFAREAFIAHLNTSDISGNEYLKLTVKQAVDGISVGGRNLLLDSGAEKTNSIPAANTMGAYYLLSDYGKGVLGAPGTRCTISFEAKSSAAGATLSVRLRGDAAEDVASSSSEVVTLTTDYVRYSGTLEITAAGAARAWFLNRASELTGTISVRSVKVELGSVATDWTPAPEDAEARILSAETAITQTQQSIGLLATKTEVTEVRTAAASAQSAASAAQSTADTAKTAAAAAQSAADEISVGGRNLARSTNQGVTGWGWNMQTGGRTIEEVVEDGVRCCRMTRDSAAQTGWSVIYNKLLPVDLLEEDTEYTLTLEVRASAATTMNGGNLYTASGTDNLAASVTVIADALPAGVWTRCEWRIRTIADFSSVALGDQWFYFRPGNSSPGVSYVLRNLKLERGNRATDWTPAPEDVASDIASLETRMSSAEVKITPAAIAATVKEQISYGGKNLLLDSGAEKTSSIPASNAMGAYYAISDYGRRMLAPAGTRCVASFEAKSSAAGATISVRLRTDSADVTSSSSEVIALTTDYVRYRCPLTVEAAGSTRLWFLNRASALTGAISIRNVQVELGDVATDWSPAPEDFAADIADNAGNLAALTSRVSAAEVDLDAAQAAISLRATREEVSRQIADADGGNLLRGANSVAALTASGAWASGLWRSASGGSGTRTPIAVSDAPESGIQRGWRLTNAENSGTDIAQDGVPVTSGRAYSMSCYARGTGTLRLQYGKGPYPTRRETLDNVTAWTRYSFTFTIGAASDGSTGGSTNIYFGNGSIGALEICGMRLEDAEAVSAAQSTADTAKTNAAAAQSTADANAASIASLATRVSSAEVKITPSAIAATVKEQISYGGTNLLLDSDFSGKSSAGIYTFDGDVATFSSSALGLTSGVSFSLTPSEGILSARGRQITFSMDYRVESAITYGTTNPWVGAQLYITYADGSANQYCNWYGNAAFPAAVTGKWLRYGKTFSVRDAEIASYGLNLYFRDATGTVKYRHPKLEIGSVATDWSPAPEDPAGGLVIGSSVSITKDEVRILSSDTSIAIPSADAEDGEEIASFDENGLTAAEATFGVVHSDSVVPTQAAATFAPANAGELQAILDNLSGHFLTGTVTIDAGSVQGGTFTLRGLSGGYPLNLNDLTANGLTITSCAARIYLNSPTFSTSGTALTVNDAKVYMGNGVINAATGVNVGEWGHVKLTNCSGTTTTLANVSSESMLRVVGATVGVNVPYGLKTGAGDVYSPVAFAAAPSAVETPTVATVSLSATNTRTWCGSWKSGSSLYQGRYMSTDSTYRRGCIWFNLSGIAGKEIVSASLKLKRYSGVGGGGAVTVNLYGTTAATASGTPAVGTKYASVSIANGQTKSVDVTAAVKALAAGTISGLMIYDSQSGTFSGGKYTYGYCRLCGSADADKPVLSVTYK